MSAQVIDLGFERSCRDVERLTSEIQARTLHAIAMLDKEVQLKRVRIESHLKVIEESVEDMRPSDTERA